MGVVGTDRGGDECCSEAVDRERTSCSCARLLCEGNRWGIMGTAVLRSPSPDPLRMCDEDAAFRRPMSLLGCDVDVDIESVVLGDEDDEEELIDDASVTEVPLDRGEDVEDRSESLSDE